MNLEKILAMNPNSKCKIQFTFTEEWEYCHYQYKSDPKVELDPNKLPLIDLDIYDLGEGGDGPLVNDDYKEVYDPAMDILEDDIFEKKDIYISKSFIALAQKKIKNLIDSGALSSDCADWELLEALEVGDNQDAIMLFNSVGCDDYELIEETNDYDNLLWFTAHEIQSEYSKFSIEEII